MTEPDPKKTYAAANSATPGSPRSFGLLFAFVFCVIGLWPLTDGRPPLIWSWAVAAVFAAVSLARPRLLHPLNLLWFRFGLALGRVVTPVVMALVFVIAVVPTGLAMRLFRKDPLRLRYEPHARSYWIERGHSSDASPSMKNQF